MGLRRFAQLGPSAGRHAVIQPQVVGQSGFLRPVLTGGAARQQLRRQRVDADGAAEVLIRVGRGVAILRQVGPPPGQFLGGQPNFLADLVAHPPQIAEADAIHRQQFAGVVDAHALQEVLRLQAVAQLGHGGVRRGRHGDGRQALRRAGVIRMNRLAGGKDRAPPPQQVFGVVEAFAVVALQGLGEERGEAFARDRVEHVALDGGLDVQHGRRGLPVAPDRRPAHRHLIERDRQREALGVQVPARGAAQRQERVEVGVRAGGDVVGRRPAQREVEQDELQLAGATLGDADVLGLDIAMGHPFGFQIFHRFDQFLAEALQQVEGQASIFLELHGHRPVARALEQQGGASGDRERRAVGDDVRVTQPRQHLALRDQPVVVRDVAGDLEDVLCVAAVILAHQQRVAGGAAPQALDDGEAAVQPVAGAGDAGVDGGFPVGGGQFVLDPIQVIQKALDRVVAGEHVGTGGELDEFLLAGAAAVQHVRQAQPLAGAQFFGQVQHRFGGRLAAEKLVGDAAERKDIQARTLRGVGAGRLRRQVDLPQVFDVVLDVLGAGGAVPGGRHPRFTDVARRGLPVHQPQAPRTAAAAIDEDALRPQGAVVQALRVGVLQRLGDVADPLQALRDRQVLALLPQQVIEAHGLRVVIEDQRRAEFGLLVVLDLEDARVVDAFENLELAAGLANPRGADLRTRSRGDRVDAHPAVYGVDADVPRFPVLKTGTLGQQLAQPVVAHLAVLVGRADAGFGQGAGDGASLRRVNSDRRAVGDAVGQRADDPGVVRGAGSAVLEGGRPGQALEPARQAARRQKDRRFDEGQPELGLGDGRLTAQQAGQTLGLAIGEEERVVDRGRSAVGRPGPAMRIAGQNARAALDLDQEEADRRQHQGIHLVDLALIVDEFEVGPDAPGIAVGQMTAQPVQRFALPSEVGLGDDLPTGVAEHHRFTSPSSWTYSNRSPTWQWKSRQSRSMAGRSTRVAVPL